MTGLPTSHRAPGRRPGLAPAVALLIVLGHALALLALQRGFDGARIAAPSRPAPVRVSLLAETAAPAREREQTLPAAPPPATGQVPAAQPPPRSDPKPEPASAERESSAAPMAAPDASADGGAGATGASSGLAAAMRPAMPDATPAGAAAGLIGTDALPPAGVGSASGGSPPADPAASPAPRDGAPLPPPVSVRLRFRVHYGDYTSRHAVAVLDYQVEAADGRYRLRTEGRAEGLTALFYSGVLSQTSTGRYGDDGLQPERHTEQRGRGGLRWAELDAATGQASFSGGQRASAPPGTQDRLSMLIQLGLIARGQPSRLAPGMALTLTELGSRSVDTVAYRSLGDETLPTDDGPLRALRLTRYDGDPARDPRIDIWLGYDQDLLPVRIRLTDPGGRVLDQILAR